MIMLRLTPSGAVQGVPANVFVRGHQLEVLGPVVVLDLVDVVDYFPRPQRASERFLHHEPMISDVAVHVSKVMPGGVSHDVALDRLGGPAAPLGGILPFQLGVPVMPGEIAVGDAFEKAKRCDGALGNRRRFPASASADTGARFRQLFAGSQPSGRLMSRNVFRGVGSPHSMVRAVGNRLITTALAQPYRQIASPFRRKLTDARTGLMALTPKKGLPANPSLAFVRRGSERGVLPTAAVAFAERYFHTYQLTTAHRFTVVF